MVKSIFNFWRGLLLSTLVSTAVADPDSTDALPQVDLGYAIHQAQLSISNQSNVYYNFSNIRYAAPPLGNLRFAATEPPLKNRSVGVQDGLWGNICPQAFATWQIGALSLNPGASNENEDCLFLDVVIPKAVYDNREDCSNNPVPVVIWLHGGGYTLGSKYAAGNPTGLLDQSLDAGSGGQIWVGINYRLGPFGWLNGPEFAKSGQTNAGLYDQRQAFEWVQEYISLFGGDPNQITIMGESAGAGSILHHVTAYGGSKSQPFNQAVMQSPAFIPKLLKNQSDTAFEIFLAAANVTTLAEARTLDTLVLQQASKISQTHTFYGEFIFGMPSTRWRLRPRPPGKLLLEGKFDSSIKVLAAHNSNEAGRYTPPTTSTSDNFTTYMLLYFPTISTTQLDYLTETLYPAVYDGSQPYTTPFHRLDLAISDFTFTCSTDWLGRAFKNQTHNYLFSISPGNHTQDVPYTYYNGPIPTVLNSTVAIMMQRYLTGFVQSGNPNRAGLPQWGVFGPAGDVFNFNQTFVDFEVDTETVNNRCTWWQQALYGDDY